MSAPRGLQEAFQAPSTSMLRLGPRFGPVFASQKRYRDLNNQKNRETSSKFCDFVLFSWSRLRGLIWDLPSSVLGAFWPSRWAKSRSRGPKRAPRPLQELKRLQDESKTPLGTNFNLSGSLRDFNIMIFRGPKVAIFGSLEHSARHPRAFQDLLKHACFVQSIPKYSKANRSKLVL